MRLFRSLLLSTTVLSASVATAEADINVVASIKPVHSLVAAVMEGVGTPDLIVDGAGSPHTYALKPSQAGNLQNADLVFWIGDRLETFLEKPIESIATKAKSVTLIESHGLNQLKFQEGGAFDSHDHEHDEHGHDDHGHDDHAEDKHDDHGHDDHVHDGYDPHVWLDPVNAKALVHEIEEALSDADPANAGTYEANATALMGRLDALVEEVQTELNPVKGRGFVVFHDAYQHFETRFGISAIGSVTVSPEVMPGAERIRELQEKVNSLDASCVFSEPQFEPKLVSTVTENTNAGTGVLDPLGASIPDGPGLYFTLIRNMASALKECLSGKGCRAPIGAHKQGWQLFGVATQEPAEWHVLW
ncbi:MAG: zinc ABC transporter substrate-binding protein ZnuA [Pseudomonadota bacterium]|nr:zinc ABC transporter substrate-binding protein ZnuA [Pseudomonadota bacterium]